MKTGLPEHTAFTDDGCDLAPKCLACPLSRCKYDQPPGSARAELHALQLAALLKQGMSIKDAAAIIGVGRRTAFRLLRRLKDGAGA